MPVNPSDFLRALVLVVTDRLQRGEDTTLPGVGTWTAAADHATGRVSVHFSTGTAGDSSIDPSLVSQVAAEVGAASGEVESRILGYARAIRAHLEDTGSVLLPGIGRLTSRQGETVFRPELIFAEAVDWDRPPPRIPEARATVDADSAEVVDEPEDLPMAPPDNEPELTVGSAVTLDQAGESEETGSEHETPDVREPEKTAPVASPPRRPAVPATPSTARTSPRRPDRRSWVVPVIAVAVVIVAAVIGVLLTRERVPEQVAEAPTGTQTGTLPTVLPADSSQASDSTGIAGMISPDSAVVDSTVPRPPIDQPEAEPAAATRQQDFDLSTEGYTLIVGSTLVESDALNSIQKYRRLGLPAAILAYESGGTTRYRLAVGLYESAARADQARQDLTDSLPDGTWVRRIRP